MINGDTGTDTGMSSIREEESINSSVVVMSPCETYHMLHRRSHYDSTYVLSTSYLPPPQQFLVIASDGLWDVMSEQDVADFVCDHLGLYLSMPSTGNNSFGNSNSSNNSSRNHVPPLLPIDAFHETAKLLAREAYVRGSMDNIGVCLIDLYWCFIGVCLIDLYWCYNMLDCISDCQLRITIKYVTSKFAVNFRWQLHDWV